MAPPPTDPDDSPAATPQRSRSVGVPLPCRGCGAETRGLAFDARCPRCGEPVWRSVSAVVDLAAALPDPQGTRRLAAAVRLLGLATLAASILTILPPSIWSDLLLDSPKSLHPLSAIGWWLAAAGFLLAARRLEAGGGRLLPTRLLAAAAPIWAIAGTLATGAFGLLDEGALSDTSRWQASAAANGCLGLLLLAAGLSIERLGPASRRWRRSGAAKQSPWLTAATQAVAMLLAGAATAAAASGWVGAATLLTLLAAAAALLVLVGSAYLAANSLWIASDLGRDRVELAGLLGEPGPGLDPQHRAR